MDSKNLLRKGLRIVVSGLNTRKKEIYFHKILLLSFTCTIFSYRHPACTEESPRPSIDFYGAVQSDQRNPRLLSQILVKRQPNQQSLSFASKDK